MKSPPKKKVKFCHHIKVQSYNPIYPGLEKTPPIISPLCSSPKKCLPSAKFIKENLYPWLYHMKGYRNILFSDQLLKDLLLIYSVLSKGYSFILDFKKGITLPPIITLVKNKWIKSEKKIKTISRLRLYLVTVLSVQGDILLQLQNDAALVIQFAWKKKKIFNK